MFSVKKNIFLGKKFFYTQLILTKAVELLCKQYNKIMWVIFRWNQKETSFFLEQHGKNLHVEPWR